MDKQNFLEIRFLPAAHGDCVLLSYSDLIGKKRNILIDAGPQFTIKNKEFNYIKETIELETKDSDIDLFIISHSDDDHIGGALKLLCYPEIERKIIKFWFNSEELISKELNKPFLKKKNYPMPCMEKGIVQTNLKQDRTLADFLKQHALDKWNDRVITKNSDISEYLKFLNGPDIKILSPSLQNLEKLYDLWLIKGTKLESEDNGISQTKGEKSYDYDKTIEQLIEKIQKENEPNTKKEDRFIEDKDEVNGGSIALLFSYENLNLLLLADAHPSTITQSINELKIADIKIDLCKLSHHGSKNNTSDELLNGFVCNNFVICANGKKNNHPNKETLVRILLRRRNCEKIYFHYNQTTKDLEEIFDCDKNTELKKTFINNFPEYNEGFIRFYKK